MALLNRLFGGRGNDAYQQGVALLEQGRAAEAVPLLRQVFRHDPGSPRGSLAGLYLRQALVEQARRLLQGGEAEPAADLLAEAVGLWPDFPDLQFQAGAASVLAGRWSVALEASRSALRRNPDYCEARLLEACALQGLERVREARESLRALLESGRRVDHELVRVAQDALDGVPPDACPDLRQQLRQTVLGDDVKRSLAEAVALCRAGRWQDGLRSLQRLGAQHPRYPDVRARHAAALYQAGDVEAALVEAEAALRINPRYRTAVSLKGLILAELGDLQEAHSFLADAVPRLEGTAGRHEELFLAYLRAVLAMLLGDLAGSRAQLAPWHDLPRQFARAALLLAACDDLAGLSDAAQRRVDELVQVWLGDPELIFLRVALLLRQKQLAAAESVLAQWPGGHKGLGDQRPLLLRARLNLLQGREPLLPESPEPPAVGASGAAEGAATQPDPTASPSPEATAIHPAAWRQLAIGAHLLRGESQLAWQAAQLQIAAAEADEETGRLFLQAAAASGEAPPEDLVARTGPPDSWLADLCRLLRRRGEGRQAELLIQRRRAVRPDLVQWSWLSAAFWLDPVRRWLG